MLNYKYFRSSFYYHHLAQGVGRGRMTPKEYNKAADICNSTQTNSTNPNNRYKVQMSPISPAGKKLREGTHYTSRPAHLY